VKAASLLGIPSSGTTGGVDSGVTVVIFFRPVLGRERHQLQPEQR